MDIPILLRGWGEAVVTNDIAQARIQKVLPQGVQLGNGFYGRIQIPLYNYYISGPSSAHQ